MCTKFSLWQQTVHLVSGWVRVRRLHYTNYPIKSAFETRFYLYLNIIQGYEWDCHQVSNVYMQYLCSYECKKFIESFIYLSIYKIM